MIDFFAEHVKNFRFERKFYLQNFRPPEVEALLMRHPAIFREIYHQRQVNNIYFDSHNLTSYADNIAGVGQRVKYRIRWYGQLFGSVDKPVLEIKLKNNHHVGKIAYALAPILVTDKLNQDTLRAVIQESSIPKNIKFHILNLEPKLMNTYQRKYFLSAHGDFRVTLDWGMKVYRLFPLRNDYTYQSQNGAGTIIEFKYNKNSDDAAEKLIQALPFRITRSSKYVMGLQSLYI